MSLPYELSLGWRYTRAGRASGRNGFISFISAVSMLGIALGVAALIIVLSVMNGFQKEVRDRMLGVISHIEVYGVVAARSPICPPRWPSCAVTLRFLGRRLLSPRRPCLGAART
jgi:ABC-type lipoprotein release transport system permease subunit